MFEMRHGISIYEPPRLCLFLSLSVTVQTTLMKKYTFDSLTRDLCFHFHLRCRTISKFPFRIKIETFDLSRRQRGRVVRAPWNLEIRVQVPLWPPAGFVPGSPWFNTSAALLQSQLVCFLPVGILNLLSLFQLFLSDYQKWSACELTRLQSFCEKRQNSFCIFKPQKDLLRPETLYVSCPSYNLYRTN